MMNVKFIFYNYKSFWSVPYSFLSCFVFIMFRGTRFAGIKKFYSVKSLFFFSYKIHKNRS